MSKIDEVTGQVKHISFWDINTYTQCVDLKPTVQLLEQLRPYVELAEMVVNSQGAYILNTQAERIELNNLIKQIKEQSK